MSSTTPKVMYLTTTEKLKTEYPHTSEAGIWKPFVFTLEKKTIKRLSE